MSQAETEAKIHAALARVLRVRAEMVRSEIYGVLEESRAGRGTHWPGARARSSAPGDPPARQSGRLQESVKIVTFDERNLVAQIGPDSHAFPEEFYAADLEHGTRTIAPRPYMRIALERVKEKLR